MSNKGPSTGSRSDRNDDDEVVYVFSSVGRELYRHTIYNALGLPPKSIHRLRYDKDWWDKNVEDEVDEDNQEFGELMGKDAVIIAASFPGNEDRASPNKADFPTKETGYRFYPLRKGEVDSAELRGETLYLDIKLTHQLADYNSMDNPQDMITSQDSYPMFGERDAVNDCFVCLQPQGSLEFLPDDNKGTSTEIWSENKCAALWNRIINELGENSAFSKTLFYRIVGLTKIDRDTTEELEPLFDSGSYGYELSSKNEYLLKLSLAFAGDTPECAANQEFLIETSNKIQVFPNKFSLGFRTDEKDIILDPNTGLDPHSASLTLNPGTPSRMSIPLRVKPSGRRKYGPFFLLFLGLLFVTFVPIIISIVNYFYQLVGLEKQLVSYHIAETIIRLVGTALAVLSLQWYGALRSMDT